MCSRLAKAGTRPKRLVGSRLNPSVLSEKLRRVAANLCAQLLDSKFYYISLNSLHLPYIPEIHLAACDAVGPAPRVSSMDKLPFKTSTASHVLELSHRSFRSVVVQSIQRRYKGS